MKLFAAFVGVLLLLPWAARAHGGPPQVHTIVQSQDGETFLANATFGLLLSRDAGASFRWVCPGALSGARLGTSGPAALGSDGRIWVASILGLLEGRADACGFSFVPSLEGEFINDVVSQDDALIVVTSNSLRDNAVYVSTDVGGSWAALPGALGQGPLPTRVRRAPSDDTRFYVSSVVPADGVRVPTAWLHRSDDGGASWERHEVVREEEDLRFFLLSVDDSNPDRLWAWMEAINEDRLLLSEDGGRSFREVASLAAFATGFGRGLAFLEDGSGRLLFGNATSGLFRLREEGLEAVQEVPSITCLAELGGALWACPKAESGAVLARDLTGGTGFAPALATSALPNIVSCGPESNVPTECEGWLDDLELDLGLSGPAGPDAGTDAGVDGGAAAPQSGCHAGPAGESDPFGPIVLLALAVVAGWRRRDD